MILLLVCIPYIAYELNILAPYIYLHAVLQVMLLGLTQDSLVVAKELSK